MGQVDLFDKRMKQCHIPDHTIEISNFGNWDTHLAAEFIYKDKNLIILGEESYLACAKLMKMKLQVRPELSMMFISHSRLENNINESDYDSLALVQVYIETTEFRKRLPGALINSVIEKDGCVLIGAHDTAHLEGAFPYDLEMLESRFELWSV